MKDWKRKFWVLNLFFKKQVLGWGCSQHGLFRVRAKSSQKFCCWSSRVEVLAQLALIFASSFSKKWSPSLSVFPIHNFVLCIIWRKNPKWTVLITKQRSSLNNSPCPPFPDTEGTLYGAQSSSVMDHLCIDCRNFKSWYLEVSEYFPPSNYSHLLLNSHSNWGGQKNYVLIRA